MRTLSQYILEEIKDKESDDKEKDEKEKFTRRKDIKFTIWESPDVKVKWIEDNDKYQKIEYKYEDRDNNISIDFLLGQQEKIWKLWVGKIGVVSYDDDPYCSFDTEKFSEAIVLALDKVEEFLQKVKDDPYDFIQFYNDI